MAAKYIEPEELAKMVKNKSLVPGRDYVIVDVRDEDFAGGHIPNARNIPAHEFLDATLDYVPALENTPRVIFHCALSQVRGPKCAKRFASTLNELRAEKCALGKEQPVPEVYILRNGFEGWDQLYGNDKELVER
ncbi:Rhodanese-like protein [Gonapodya prolifera JEL478]|uniref:Rhodanese-like protein n=1 Tax=Gonapodya prolifera (strain JEL478) TaxID=1344416 RepID=A0A139A751_GONPJ|nr:Rhodanese-like protein [Gonapodya prolifera JEL478]|eukprot:KXS12544.1 Rhodanese-like protein [Gonapodya prolifera JEL478]